MRALAEQFETYSRFIERLQLRAFGTGHGRSRPPHAIGGNMQGVSARGHYCRAWWKYAARTARAAARQRLASKSSLAGGKEIERLGWDMVIRRYVIPPPPPFSTPATCPNGPRLHDVALICIRFTRIFATQSIQCPMVFCLLSFVFCLLSFVFCLLSFVFCLLSFVFRLSSFVFRLSSFVFCILYFVSGLGFCLCLCLCLFFSS